MCYILHRLHNIKVPFQVMITVYKFQNILEELFSVA